MKILIALLSLLFLSNNVIYAQGKAPVAVPNFKFYNVINGSAVTKANLLANKPTIVFYFDPTCEHCMLQSEWLKKDIFKLAGAQLVYVTWEENASKVIAFKNKYFPNIKDPVVTFTQDKDYKIDSYFGESQVPSIFIFDKTQKLRKVLNKETPVAELITYLK